MAKSTVAKARRRAELAAGLQELYAEWQEAVAGDDDTLADEILRELGRVAAELGAERGPASVPDVQRARWWEDTPLFDLNA